MTRRAPADVVVHRGPVGPAAVRAHRHDLAVGEPAALMVPALMVAALMVAAMMVMAAMGRGDCGHRGNRGDRGKKSPRTQADRAQASRA
jgi:hypothetical protein